MAAAGAAALQATIGAGKPPLPKPPSRCAAPGYKKAQRQAQEAELGLQPGGRGAPRSLVPPACASRATAFTLAGDASLLPQEVMDLFREADPDAEARVLERWAQHNRELRRGQKAQE